MNAREELEGMFLRYEKTPQDIAYGIVHYGRSYWDDDKKNTFSFEKGTSPSIIDFNYDSGYGGQELYGCIVFEDGSWLERGEYDGSEWWGYKSTPTYDEVLRSING